MSIANHSTRWQQSLAKDNYMEWMSYSTYLMALSRISFAENGFCTAADLACLSGVAYQRALDLQPVDIEEAA